MSNISSLVNFQGVWPDILTPLQPNLSIDEPTLGAHLRNLSAKGLENFVLFGQAGEGPSFSVEEKLSALGFIIEMGIDAKNILLGINSSSFSEIAQFIQKAYAMGARRFLVSTPPHDQAHSQLGLFDYFDQIIKQIDQSNWQLFIHQLGAENQASDLPEVTLSDLKKAHPNIFVGIIDQDKHVNHTLDLIRTFDKRLVIATCHEPNLSILNPTEVCVSALANIIPNVIKKVINNDFINNATKISGMKVVKPDDRVTELMSIVSNYPRVAALKLMLSQYYRMEGWERIRPPNTTLSIEGRQTLISALKRFNLKVYE